MSCKPVILKGLKYITDQKPTDHCLFQQYEGSNEAWDPSLDFMHASVLYNFIEPYVCPENKSRLAK